LYFEITDVKDNDARDARHMLPLYTSVVNFIVIIRHHLPWRTGWARKTAPFFTTIIALPSLKQIITFWYTRHYTADFWPRQLVTNLLRTCRLCCRLVTDLLRGNFGETGVMDCCLYILPYRVLHWGVTWIQHWRMT